MTYPKQNINFVAQLLQYATVPLLNVQVKAVKCNNHLLVDLNAKQECVVTYFAPNLFIANMEANSW